MIAISAHEINKYYGANHVLKGVSFEIYSGEKVGLLGRNGSGKTTLFKIIAGDEPYESGSVSRAKNKRIEVLAQIPDFDGTVEEILCSSFRDNWEINKICNGMGISETVRYSPFRQLSGGEKTRVNLARILLRDCDILLLDEPTNHLDIDSLAWLEKFLQGFAGTVVVISHDRVFLDNVIDRVIEVDDGKAHFFSGNYSWYAEEKIRRFTYQSEQYQRQQKEIKRIEDRAKWFLQNDRFTRAHKVILKRIDHMDKIDKPTTTKKMTEDFNCAGYTAKEVVTFDSVCKSYDENKLLDNISLTIRRNDRIALVGANGCGKTTLLKLIMGEQECDSGIVKVSSNAKVAYLPQIVRFDDENATALDILRYTTGLPQDKARNILAGFRFIDDDVFKRVCSLSGGEKSRLKLCLLMQDKVNFMLMDEPTNHLDIESREWFEDAVANFSGTMLFITHDRYFLSKFATRVWSMENGRIVE